MFGGPLFRRYFGMFALVVAALWIPGIAVETWLAYAEGVRSAAEIQGLEVDAAKTLIEQHLRGIEHQIREVASFASRGDMLDPQALRGEFHRLLKVEPAVHEIQDWD